MLDKKGQYEIEIEGRAATNLYFKSTIKFKGSDVYQYHTAINPHVIYSSIHKLISEEEDLHNETDSKENVSEEEFLDPEDVSDFSKVNMWSLLAGRQIKMRITNQMKNNIELVDNFFICNLRNKNPYYQEKYSLMFRFKDVMTESGYISSKFLL